MTKNEAAILNYIKQHKDCANFDVMNNAKTPDRDRYVSAKDRLQLMIDLGYVSGDALNPKIDEDGSVHTLTITALGLHELDEFLENQSRISRLESDALINCQHAYVANLIAAGSLIIGLLALLK